MKLFFQSHFGKRDEVNSELFFLFCDWFMCFCVIVFLNKISPREFTRQFSSVISVPRINLFYLSILPIKIEKIDEKN